MHCSRVFAALGLCAISSAASSKTASSGSTSVSSSSICIPSPTQPVQNPSFEGPNTKRSNWHFLNANVAANGTAVEPYSGSHFARLNPGVAEKSVLSQTVDGVFAGASYTLSYAWTLLAPVTQHQECLLQLAVNGTKLGSTTLTHQNWLKTGAAWTSATTSNTFTANTSSSVDLSITYTCNSGNAPALGLDEIKLTTSEASVSNCNGGYCPESSDPAYNYGTIYCGTSVTEGDYLGSNTYGDLVSCAYSCCVAYIDTNVPACCSGLTWNPTTGECRYYQGINSTAPSSNLITVFSNLFGGHPNGFQCPGNTYTG